MVVPGLLGPLPGEPGSPLGARMPHLERWLCTAQRLSSSWQDASAALLGLLGLDCPAGADLPTGALAALGEGLDVPEGQVWSHADPVFLRAAPDHLRLFDERVLGLSSEEAASLAALFNRHFGGEGMRLHTPAPDRWYLALPGRSAMRTCPVLEVVGRDIHSSLPTGADARRWIGLMNEAQMLFHGTLVNERREQAGGLGVNGIWLWGVGALPPPCARREGLSVFGDHPLVRGLARWGRVPWGALSTDWTAVAEAGEALVFFDSPWKPVCYGETASWIEALDALERRLGTLDRALAAGRLREVRLYPGNGDILMVRRRNRWLLWRRRRPLEAWVERLS